MQMLVTADEGVIPDEGCKDLGAEFRKKFYPKVSNKDWNDWRWQLANQVRTSEKAEELIGLTRSESEALRMCSGLPFGVTPYYMSLLYGKGEGYPLRRTMIPVVDEMLISSGESADPLGEDGHSPVEGIVHRYPDRVLFLSTEKCSAYCRYCTRSRVVGHGRNNSMKERWQAGIDYIKKHPEIRDVLISGGDPLVLPDESIEFLLKSIRAIEHVEIIRIGTKTPVVLPQRITPKLVKILKKYSPLWMSLHFAHPDELTPETRKACSRLADAGIPLGSQTVLLKGVNDEVKVLTKLFQGLLKTRVRPYYLYQCDPIAGSSHFRTSVSKGLEMIKGIRGFTSGYAVPQYVIDAPGGGGKIPLLPEYYIGRENGHVMLRNFEGELYSYPDHIGDAEVNKCL